MDSVHFHVTQCWYYSDPNCWMMPAVSNAFGIMLDVYVIIIIIINVTTCLEARSYSADLSVCITDI
jgi:hypothetical protein